MISCIRNTASCTFTVFTGIFAASSGALFAAIYSQLALGLDPCVLCLYQRMPFFAGILLSLAGLSLRHNKKAVAALLAACVIVFLINAGIAAYHSGVEQHWWVSAVEGCAVPDFSKDPTLLEKILTKPAASCETIAWKDPILGLSMANWNIFYSLGLALGSLAALFCACCCKGNNKAA